MTPDLDFVKKAIVRFFSKRQITDFDSYVRSKEYKGYWLNDNDAPVYPYRSIDLGYSLDTISEAIKEMKLDGLVELVLAVNEEGRPNGSGWSLTEKGLHFAVDNDLINN